METKILLIRGKNIILDRDLAELYGLTIENLNEAVKKDIEQFPEDSIFQLSKDEYESLKFQSGPLKKNQRLEYLPQAFTQEVIALLPSILNSKRAIEANIQILGTFNRRREMLLRYKDESYRDTFEIACNKMSDLNELDMNRFSNVMQLLGDDITDQIEDFMACNKGILLVGSDYDLLSGAAAYIWYTHPLDYSVSGNECVEDEYGRALLQHKDFCGYSEKEIEVSLFSQPDGLMNKYKAGTVLFLRDIKTQYTDVLERLARTIRGFKPRRVGSESVWIEYQPNIVIINVKQIDGLLEDSLKNFEVIKLEPGKKSKIISEQQSLERPTNETANNVLLDDANTNEDKAPISLNNCIFTYKGGHWEIIFGGKKIIPPDMKGFGYIAYILSNPNEEFHNFRLHNLVNGQITGSLTKEQSFDAKLNPERSTKISETKQDKRDEYNRYKDMLSALDQEDEELNTEQFELEKDGIETSRLLEINEQLSRNSETRKLIAQDINSDVAGKSEKKKIVNNVYMNIYRSLQVIDKRHSLLRKHLKAFFTNGKEYTSYHPDMDYPWQTYQS